MAAQLLEVRGLTTYFFTSDGTIRAVDEVSFSVAEGETLALVGESGCGKSVTSLSVMRLLPTPPGKIVSGEVIFKGHDLLQLTENEMQRVRGNEISMVFQEPMTSLNPVYSVGYQIAECIQVHQKMSRRASEQMAIDMLKLTGIPSAERRAREFPHQLSGGMRQRVMIAMALACNPSLLIADEPTTALDVTVQAQILDLLRKLKDELGMAILLITHDLGVVAEMAERVAVMYAGRLVEEGKVGDLFASPLHPYTEGLLSSIPRMDQVSEKLNVIKGSVPNPAHLPAGCRFAPRCPYAWDRCYSDEPAIETINTRKVACWRRVVAS
ncbi:MAG: ABC transporter ATP-binding protein [Symbiobacteriaceae bacterium]|nr:ABC transporter ATP-binding protein [Symbiobacteriaceae bacterium]